MTDYPTRHVTETEARLTSLYALERFGACSGMQLLEFMVGADIMNYFDLQLALYALRSNGQAARSYPQEGVESYCVTEAGREALALFANRAPVTIREHIDASAAEWRERIRRENELIASSGKDTRGQYVTKLQIAERGVPLLTVELTLPTQALADIARVRWADKAEAVYQYLMRVMAGEEGQ